MGTGALRVVAAILVLVVTACGGESEHRDGGRGGASGSPSGGGTSGSGGGSSGTGGGSSGAGGGSVASDFPRRLAEEHCNALRLCCIREALSDDAAACADSLEALYTPAFQAGLSEPNIVFVPEAAERCLEAYRVALTACDDRELAQRIDNACEAMFRGTVAQGQPCQESHECAAVEGAQVYCDESEVCLSEPVDPPSPPRPGLGDACGGSCTEGANWSLCSSSSTDGEPVAYCQAEDGLYCSEARVCEPAPGVGEPCPTSACDVESYCADGTCVAATVAGPCSYGDQCVRTSICDDDSSTCVPLGPNNDPCMTASDCISQHCAGGICRAWSLATPEACEGRALAGAY